MTARPLPALAQPIGLFPAYIARRNECLVFKGRYVSDSLDITTITGQPLLTVKDEFFSISSRKLIFDTNTNVHLCTIRKEHGKMFHDEYYVETPDSFQRLMKLEPRSCGKKNTITFANAAAGGAPTELFYRGDSESVNGSIVEKSSGQLVADIDRQHFKLREELHVNVPQGMDLVAIVAIVAICVATIEDRSVSVAAIGGGGA